MGSTLMADINAEAQELPIAPPTTFENTKPGAGQTTRGAIVTRTQRHPKPSNLGIPAGSVAPPTIES